MLISHIYIYITKIFTASSCCITPPKINSSLFTNFALPFKLYWLQLIFSKHLKEQNFNCFRPRFLLNKLYITQLKYTNRFKIHESFHFSIWFDPFVYKAVHWIVDIFGTPLLKEQIINFERT